jgi:hypothetical protein
MIRLISIVKVLTAKPRWLRAAWWPGWRTLPQCVFAGVGSTTRGRGPFFGVVLPRLAMQEDDDVAQGVHVSAVSPRVYAINAAGTVLQIPT